MIIKEFTKDINPREIFIYTCQRISEPLSELGFKYRKSKNDILKQYGDVTFTISFEPSIKFGSTTFSVFISVDSKVLKKCCNDKYPNETATGNIIHTTLARLTKLDNEWPQYHLSTSLERERCIKEINLLGQNVNAYLGVMDDGEIADFALLLEYLHEIPGIERIRYTTSHPKEFTTRLIEAYRNLPKLVNHLHLPVQSGSDRVLAAMKRGYSVLEYKSIIRKLRAIRPDISLSSDFIVGFPGETEADFAATMKLIEELNFDESYSFVYSPRPGTPAADLPDETPQEVKLERLHRLQAQINQQARKISQNMVNSVQRVLLEGTSKKNAGEFCGRTDNNRVVNLTSNPEHVGNFINVRITEARAHSLRGEMLPE